MEPDPFLAMDYAAPAPVEAPATVTSAGDVDDLLGIPSGGDGDADATIPPKSNVAAKPIAFVDAFGDEVRVAGPTTANPPSAPAAPVAAPSAAPSSSSSSSSKSPADLANEELAVLLMTKRLAQDEVSSLQSVLRENASLKDKISKLKSLLGRSAKAQRDAKNDLEKVKRQCDEAELRADALELRAEALANRPTHMDLLADFETNFDRALLSIGASGAAGGGGTGQSGGEDPSSGDAGNVSGGGVGGVHNSDDDEYGDDAGNSASPSSHRNRHTNANSGRDSLLLTELSESKARCAHLESLHASLLRRTTHLERAHESLNISRERDRNSISNLQLELRMAKMETEHASRDSREKDASLAEMQLEIDLVARSAAEANKRAAEGMEVARTARRDGEYVDGLEAKVVALQEWALASTEAKRLTADRARGLEDRVKELEMELLVAQAGVSGGGAAGGDGAGEGCATPGSNGGGHDASSLPLMPRIPSSNSIGIATADLERKLWTRQSSLVVGAGMVGHTVLELGQVHVEPYESVVLRWKFDLTPADLDVYFSVLKGVHEDKKRQKGADACFRSRHVLGGGGGDVSGAFAVQNACTLVWSNEMSWVRPRTIKWTVEAIAVE